MISGQWSSLTAISHLAGSDFGMAKWELPRGRRAGDRTAGELAAAIQAKKATDRIPSLYGNMIRLD